MKRFPMPTFVRRKWTPSADIYRTSYGWLVKMELAGVQPGDVLVEVHGTQLLVAGRRKDVLIDLEQQCQSLEISYDSFERQFEFSFEITQDMLETEFLHGMLLIHIHLRQSRS